MTSTKEEIITYTATDKPATSQAADMGVALPKVILALDGPSLFYRAYHAYERNKDVKKDFAVQGFFSLLGGILEKARPQGLVVGFDDENQGERASLYPLYKATRREKPQELKDQLQKVQSILEDLGVLVITPVGLEADDVVASVSKSAEEKNHKVIIATSDRDSFALVSKNTGIMRLTSGLKNAVWVNESYLLENYGIKAFQYLDFAALRGDASDNLPGVKGFGEKTAQKLLKDFKSVEEALLDPEKVEEVLGKSAKEKLFHQKDQFFLVKDVMRLKKDLKVDLEKAFTFPKRETLEEVFKRENLQGLSPRFLRVFKEQAQHVKAVKEANKSLNEISALASSKETSQLEIKVEAKTEEKVFFGTIKMIPGTPFEWPKTF